MYTFEMQTATPDRKALRAAALAILSPDAPDDPADKFADDKRIAEQNIAYWQEKHNEALKRGSSADAAQCLRSLRHWRDRLNMLNGVER